MTAIRNRVLICGSRLAIPIMYDFAWKLVRTVKYYDPNWPSMFGAFINVGDAGGIDFAVVAACNKFNVDYMCFGITRTGRNPQARNYICAYTGRYTSTAFLQRDQEMVRASSHCIGIHNLASETHGTEFTCDYAAKTLEAGRTRRYDFDPLTGKVNTIIL